MAKRLRVMAVCGFGVGTSMVLKMKLEEVFGVHGIQAEYFTADATTASSEPCDVIFTSNELARTLNRPEVPVVVIDNFLNSREIEEKGLPVLRSLLESAGGCS